MKNVPTAAVFAVIALSSPAFATTENYVLDASHSQIVFSYDHLGYSTNYGMFSGFEGQIAFDQANPTASFVNVTFPVRSMLTGWEDRFEQFMGEDFFGADENEMVIFTSTGIEVTGGDTALITGDLTLNGVTKSVVLDTKLNQIGDHPIAQKPWAGFDATTTLLRSDFGVGAFAPFISDEIAVSISVEAMQVE